MWISHLTVMFAALSSVCWGFAYTCVEQLMTVTSVGTGYVDDVTLGLSVRKEHPQNETTVKNQLKRMSQLWERLLYICGGRLELSKCFWVPITWKWKKGHPSCQKQSDRSTELWLRESETGERIKIPRVLYSDAEKRLGVRSSCDGLWNAEFNYWMEFSKIFGLRVRRAGLGRMAGFIAYHSMWISKFRYSAPVIGFNNSQLQKIQKSVVNSCLSAAGYCNRMPRAVVYGTDQYGGMEWDAIGIVFLYEKLKLLIGSVRLQDTVGRLMNVQLSWLQLFSGISTPLFEANMVVPYLPKGWLTNLHGHLVYNNIQVVLAAGWVPSKQRSNDRVLMDIVVHSFPEWMWGGINRCRLYLEATTVADITTLDGTFVPQDIRLVKRKLRKNKLAFPAQSKPGKKDIHYWTHFMDTIAINGHLHAPLGKWTRSSDQEFQFMLDRYKKAVYKQTSRGWQVFGTRRTSNKRMTKLDLIVNSLPEGCLPIRAIEAAKYLIVLDNAADNCMMHNPIPDLYTHRQQEMKKNIMGQYFIDTELYRELEERWHQPDTIIVGATDGGLKSSIGTSSYAVFLPQNDTPVIAGFAREYQPQPDASSTRQELLGQLGLEYWLQTLKDRWGIPRNSIKMTLVTDSQSSIDILENTGSVGGIRHTLMPEMDVAMELFDQRNAQWWILRNIQKVQSHIPLSDAPDEFYWTCNDTVDTLATRARESVCMTSLQAQVSHVLVGSRASCRIAGRLVNNNLYQRLKEELAGEKLKWYLIEKYDWSEHLFHGIAWTAHQRELKKVPRYRRVTLQKFIHGWLATNKRRNRTESSTPPNCIFCGIVECRNHIFECSNNQLKMIRDHRWKQLMKDVLFSTDPAFGAVFQAGLNTVVGGPKPDDRTITEWPTGLRRAYELQSEIGWSHVLYGRLSVHWEGLAMYQGRYGDDQGQFHWTSKVI